MALFAEDTAYFLETDSLEFEFIKICCEYIPDLLPKLEIFLKRQKN